MRTTNHILIDSLIDDIIKNTEEIEQWHKHTVTSEAFTNANELSEGEKMLRELQTKHSAQRTLFLKNDTIECRRIIHNILSGVEKLEEETYEEYNRLKQQRC